MKRMVLASLSLLIIAGCSQTSETKSNQPLELKYVKGSNDWSFLKKQNASDNVMEAYQFAVAHPEVLKYMPCYCGCGEEDGHQSNEDCFVKSTTDKEVLLDTMGFS